MKSNIIYLVSLLTLVGLGHCLDCYVCLNQDSNDHKCVTSVKNCQQEHDMCMTEIYWSTMPYWQAGAKKQFYISKRCATKHECNTTMKRVQNLCTHVWYEDWRCAECCAGDKCNYYVFSGVQDVAFNGGLGLLCLLLVVWWTTS